MLLCCLALLSWLAVGTRGDDTCAPSPLAIAIGNVTLATNNTARGLEVSVGTPPQPFVFMPQWTMNNTFAFGTDGHCSTGYSTSRCTTYRGGAYDTLASTTRTVANSAAYPVDASPWASFSMVSDTLVLNNSTSVADFPIGVPLNDLGQQGYHPMGGLGLGFNSTLLNTLKSTGQIASRSWSMFWGLNGATQQMDGLFVFGGYDKAKVQNQQYTQDITYSNSDCGTGMVMSITDMILNFSNGTDASIFPSSASTALQVCLVPDYPTLMTIPLDPYFENFESLTNQTVDDRSNGLVFYANRYAPGADVYSGDITIKFQSGLSVRVPNDQFIVPDRYIDSDGIIVANTSGPDTTFLSIQDVNANDMSILGRQFLSVAYLLYNQDAEQFSLWEANPTTNRDIVAVDDTGAEISSFCTAAASGTVTASVSSSDSSTSDGSGSSSGGSSVSAGAIAGIAIGSVAGVALAAGAVLLCLRRQRRRRQVQASNNIAAAGDGSAPMMLAPTYGYMGGQAGYPVVTYMDSVAPKTNTNSLAEMSAVSTSPSRNQSVPYQPVSPGPTQHYELMG